jgi:eukaryotic-like serine/threonine-protein kinase
METEPRASAVPTGDDRDLRAGHPVGEYLVEAKIGEGGFGAVYRGSHPLIGKLAAIKVLHRRYSADPEMVSRFVAEARAVNQIRHRNIIDIFAFGQLDDGRSYYVMELLDGQPLDACLRQGGPIPLGEAIPILRAVARALDAAHAKGIAHRDLKPENIFLARESDGAVFPKLLDFGIAKLLGEASQTAMHKTRTGAPIGTPYYMSPEQCRGRQVDHRTDIYAFGIVAYQVLTGEVPFEGEDYMAILLKQIGEEPTPPSQRPGISPPVPRAVDDAIAWMMKKDPADRPANLITAMRALEEAALAAGIELAVDPSGLTSTTSRLAAQRTPSEIRPVPAGGTSGAGASAGLGSAETVDAARLGDDVAAAVARTLDGAAPRRRRGPVLALALAGLLVVAGAVVVLVRGGGGAGSAEEGVRGPAGDEAPDPGGAAPAGAGAPTAGTGAGRGGDALPGGGEPPFVRIRVEGPPPGTEVYGPRGLVGAVPGELQLDRAEGEILLTFKADGHVTTTRQVVPSQDGALEVTLERKPVEPAGREPAPRGRGKDRGRAGKGGAGDPAGAGDPGAGTPGPSGRDQLEDPFDTP